MLNMNVTKMQGQNQQDGTLIYQCVCCEKECFSSQATTHTRRHFKDGWIKGTSHRKLFVPFTNFQQQQLGSTTISSIAKQQQQQHAFPTKASHVVSTHVMQLPSSPTLSRRFQPQHPRHRLRIYDPKSLARFKAHLTKMEKDTILTLLDIYFQGKESSKKRSEVEVTQNKDSEEAPVFGNTNNM